MGVIIIGPIRVYGYHGCLPEEAIIGGEYSVIIKITADLYEAEKNDELSSTVDYCDVHDIVVREMKVRSKLIEHAAARIAEALKKELPQIETVEVSLAKMTPPMNGDVDQVCVVVSRE